MINVAICDDDREFCERLSNYIEELYFDKHNLLVDIYTDCDTLLERIKTDNYDIILLDIEFGNNSEGIHTGNRIRDEILNDYIQIIYISAKSDYAMKLFDSRPLNFLTKPIDKRELYKSMNKAIKLCNDCVGVLKFKISGEYFKLMTKDIIYVTKKLRKIQIVTKSGNYEYYGKLEDIDKQLSNVHFVKVHKGVIVNVSCIKAYRRDGITLVTGELLPVSRTYKENVKKIVADWGERL